MQLCVYRGLDVTEPARLGVLRGTEVVDAHRAHVASMAGHMSPRRAAEIAAALVPSDLVDFVLNGRHGWAALRDGLARLGPSLDPALHTPQGHPVVHPAARCRLEPLVDRLGASGDLRTFVVDDDSAGPFVALVGTGGRAIDERVAWEHVVAFAAERVDGGRVLLTPDELDQSRDVDVWVAIAEAVSEASRTDALRPGDVIAGGVALAPHGRAEVDVDAQLSVVLDLVERSIVVERTPAIDLDVFPTDLLPALED